MQYNEFRRRIMETLPVNTTLPNPGGGDSEILSYTSRNIGYQRGKSTIRVAFEDLYRAYTMFQGEIVDSTQLKRYNPKVFDSKKSGHSCNCSFFYLLLKAIGIVDKIEGAGKRGSPFRVRIPSLITKNQKVLKVKDGCFTKDRSKFIEE